jgi:tRNA pseudouridine38-40 synthase
MRIALGVEYDGTEFHGWQIQKGVRTVQASLEAALSRVAAHPVTVICAGRTDRGVHALGQVVHFDTVAVRASHKWVFGACTNLPVDVSVVWAVPVDPGFHARFSAISRHYRYVILNRPVRPTIWRTRAAWVYRPLEVSRMADAARFLIGKHDFSSFRAQECQAKSPVRTVCRLEVTRRGDFVIFDAEADAFLHHMVRNIAGVLVAIGSRQQEPEWARQVLKARDRCAGGVTAVPNGLYLMKVQYPAHFEVPALSWDSRIL